jgi:hypothetical protein
MKRKPKIDDFIKVCNAKGGIISSVASALNVSRGTIYIWCSKNPKFEEAINDAREAFIDLAETQLQSLVKGIPKIIINEKGQKEFVGWEVPPSESAIIFSLRTLGRKRGYSERSEIDHTTNGKDMNQSIQVEIIDRREQVDQNTDD